MRHSRSANAKKFLKLTLALYTFLLIGIFSLISTTLIHKESDKVEAQTSCTTAAECYGLVCEWPDATYCTYGDARYTTGSEPGSCICLRGSDQPASNNGCVVNPPTTCASTLAGCPTGWEDCGTSNQRAGDAGCVRMDSISCQERCPTCQNPSYLYRYCRQVVTPPPPPQNPFCGDGICNATGEYCERSAPGSNTFVSCSNGQPVGSCRGVENNQPVTAATCNYCGDGIRQPVEECDYAVDSNCNLNCTTQAQLEEGISIDKRVLEDRVYQIGEIVRFNIRITNTGQTTLTSVRFRDTWDPTYLRFVGGSARASSGPTIDNIVPVLSSQSNNQIIINDVTDTVLGNLAPGQYFEFTLSFTALAPTPNYNPETCNFAFTSTPTLPEISDSDCVPIQNRDTDI